MATLMDFAIRPIVLPRKRVKKLQTNIQFNKLTSVFLCVCPVIDHEFRHNIVKVAVDPQTTLTMLWRNSLSITEQTH